MFPSDVLCSHKLCLLVRVPYLRTCGHVKHLPWHMVEFLEILDSTNLALSSTHCPLLREDIKMACFKVFLTLKFEIQVAILMRL